MQRHHQRSHPLPFWPLLQTRRRSALCTARAIGYLIQYLDHVVVNANFSSGVISLDSPFSASKQHSDFSSKEQYASRQVESEQRDLVGLSLDATRRSELLHLAGESIGAEDTICVCLLFLTKGDRYKTCLKIITPSQFTVLQPFTETIVPVADVSYSLAETTFKHSINFLQIKSSALSQLGNDFLESLGDGAEWVVPRKVDNGYSLNFLRHTQNIARSLVFEILRHEAAQELCRMEHVQTNQLIIRFQERSSVSDGIVTSKRQREEAHEECNRAAQYVRDVFQDTKTHLTINESTNSHSIQRKILDELYSIETEFLTTSKQFEARSARRLEGLGRRTKLIETPETSWVFECFDPQLSGQMKTSTIRHAMISLETHSTFASVNESLQRQGKELHSVPYIQI